MRRFAIYMGVTIAFVLGVILTSPGEALHPIEDPFAPDFGPCVVNCAPANPVAGDDNGDGVIDEDESGWDCRTMGNRICGTSLV
jgi:hypothetical protein